MRQSLVRQEVEDSVSYSQDPVPGPCAEPAEVHCSILSSTSRYSLHVFTEQKCGECLLSLITMVTESRLWPYPELDDAISHRHTLRVLMSCPLPTMWVATDVSPQQPQITFGMFLISHIGCSPFSKACVVWLTSCLCVQSFRRC